MLKKAIAKLPLVQGKADSISKRLTGKPTKCVSDAEAIRLVEVPARACFALVLGNHTNASSFPSNLAPPHADGHFHRGHPISRQAQGRTDCRGAADRLPRAHEVRPGQVRVHARHPADRRPARHRFNDPGAGHERHHAARRPAAAHPAASTQTRAKPARHRSVSPNVSSRPTHQTSRWQTSTRLQTLPSS